MFIPLPGPDAVVAVSAMLGEPIVQGEVDGDPDFTAWRDADSGLCARLGYMDPRPPSSLEIKRCPAFADLLGTGEPPRFGFDRRLLGITAAELQESADRNRWSGTA